MREVFDTAARWLDDGRPFALATLITLRDAAPAPVGTTVAVDAVGRIVGNIGAGCHESEIIEAAQQTARDGRTRRVDINLSTEDDIFNLPGCGAILQVVTWRPPRAFSQEARAIVAGQQRARVAFDYVDAGGSKRTFEMEYPPKESLILIGATALAAELAAIAPRADFNVIVVDPRPSFATRERLGDSAEIVRDWPADYLPKVLSERTHVVMLSHDPKFDLPALRCALRSRAPYVGLLGSRRSQSARRSVLAEEGFDESDLARIRGPAGLDIGGATIAETALSILAEIVANRHERNGTPLSASTCPIH
jgi:xanthine dehydrogenase accessory factor